MATRLEFLLIFLLVGFLNAANADSETRPPVVLSLRQIPQTLVAYGSPIEFPHDVETQLRKEFQAKPGTAVFIPQHSVVEDAGADLFESSSRPTAVASNFQLFPGIKDTGKHPADPILAAGPDHLMAAVNSTVAVYHKSGSKIFQTTFASWFSTLPEAAGLGLFDPKVTYDEYSGHFIFLCAAAGGAAHRSLYLFSVSKTSDATGDWAFWSLDMQLNNAHHANVFADFPGLGFDSEAIYLTGNIFNLSPFHYSYAKIRILKKSEVYSFGALHWRDFFNFKDATGAKAINVQPAQSFGNLTRGYLLSSNANHGNKLTLWSITDPTGSPALHKRAVLVSSYHFPPNAPQKGGKRLINTGDAGLTNVVFADGSLYAANSIAFDFGSGQVAALRFYNINTNGTVIQETTFGNRDFFYYYPVVMVDSHNDVAIAFNRSSANSFAGVFFSGRRSNDPAGTLEATTRIKAGQSYYDEPNENGVDLWGDYNGIALDPDDSIWIFSMFARSLHQWGTRGAKFHF